MRQTREEKAEELTNSYINGNISTVRAELKKRGGRWLFAQIFANLYQNMNPNEAATFRRLMER